MITIPPIRLATSQDAAMIAEMSRDYIEHGLGWSWTPARVLAAVRDRATNIAVVGDSEAIAGFGIMQYGDDTAHLALLAVRPNQQQCGLGALLMAWLEKPALVAGIERVRLEARADNPNAIGFYRRQGYREVARVSGYYRGTVDAVRLEKRFGSGLGTLAR
ncbi:MAG TPA: N-acetyltransferase [Steroidobacteraceae bacterium]|jgi:ribosomal-protein-alanine N-acetyltransferase|nr:N-acetyltransferase [Steroidobacteraceae bacterium]